MKDGHCLELSVGVSGVRSNEDARVARRILALGLAVGGRRRQAARLLVRQGRRRAPNWLIASAFGVSSFCRQ
jgi:hypothetical protein